MEIIWLYYRLYLSPSNRKNTITKGTELVFAWKTAWTIIVNYCMSQENFLYQWLEMLITHRREWEWEESLCYKSFHFLTMKDQNSFIKYTEQNCTKRNMFTYQYPKVVHVSWQILICSLKWSIHLQGCNLFFSKQRSGLKYK